MVDGLEIYEYIEDTIDMEELAEIISACTQQMSKLYRKKEEEEKIGEQLVLDGI